MLVGLYSFLLELKIFICYNYSNGTEKKSILNEFFQILLFRSYSFLVLLKMHYQSTFTMIHFQVTSSWIVWGLFYFIFNLEC